MLCGSNGGAEETTSRTETRQTRDDQKERRGREKREPQGYAGKEMVKKKTLMLLPPEQYPALLTLKEPETEGEEKLLCKF